MVNYGDYSIGATTPKMVNSHRKLWKENHHHAINGKTHYFDWAMSNSYVDS
jgi:hypothetical protein